MNSRQSPPTEQDKLVTSLYEKLLTLEHKYLNFVRTCTALLEEKQIELTSESVSFSGTGEVNTKRVKLEQDLGALMEASEDLENNSELQEVFSEILSKSNETKEKISEFVRNDKKVKVKERFNELIDFIWQRMFRRETAEEKHRKNWATKISKIENEKKGIDRQFEEKERKLTKKLKGYKEILYLKDKEKQQLENSYAAVLEKYNKQSGYVLELKMKVKEYTKRFELNPRERTLKTGTLHTNRSADSIREIHLKNGVDEICRKLIEVTGTVKELVQYLDGVFTGDNENSKTHLRFCKNAKERLNSDIDEVFYIANKGILGNTSVRIKEPHLDNEIKDKMKFVTESILDKLQVLEEVVNSKVNDISRISNILKQYKRILYSKQSDTHAERDYSALTQLNMDLQHKLDETARDLVKSREDNENIKGELEKTVSKQSSIKEESVALQRNIQKYIEKYNELIDTHLSLEDTIKETREALNSKSMLLSNMTELLQTTEESLLEAITHLVKEPQYKQTTPSQSASIPGEKDRETVKYDQQALMKELAILEWGLNETKRVSEQKDSEIEQLNRLLKQHTDHEEFPSECPNCEKLQQQLDSNPDNSQYIKSFTAKFDKFQEDYNQLNQQYFELDQITRGLREKNQLLTEELGKYKENHLTSSEVLEFEAKMQHSQLSMKNSEIQTLNSIIHSLEDNEDMYKQGDQRIARESECEKELMLLRDEKLQLEIELEKLANENKLLATENSENEGNLRKIKEEITRKNESIASLQEKLRLLENEHNTLKNEFLVTVDQTPCNPNELNFYVEENAKLCNELASVKTELKTLQEEFSSLTNDYETVLEDNQIKEGLLEDKLKLLTSSIAEIDKLNSIMQKTQNKHSKLQEDLEQKTEECLRLHRENNRASYQTEQLKTELATKGMEITQLSHEKETDLNLIQTLKNQISALKEQDNSYLVPELSEKLLNLQLEFKKQSELLDAHKGSNQGKAPQRRLSENIIDYKLKELEDLLDSKSLEIQKLRDKLSEKDIEIQNFSIDIEHLYLENTELSKKSKGHVERIHELEQNHRTNLTELDNFKTETDSKLLAKDKGINEFKRKYEDCTKWVNQLENKLQSTHKSEIATIKRELDTTRNNLDALGFELANAVDTLKETNDKHKAKKQQLKEKICNLETQLTQTTELKERNEKKLGKLLSELSNTDQMNEEIQQSLSELLEGLVKLNSTFESTGKPQIKHSLDDFAKIALKISRKLSLYNQVSLSDEELSFTNKNLILKPPVFKKKSRPFISEDMSLEPPDSKDHSLEDLIAEFNEKPAQNIKKMRTHRELIDCFAGKPRNSEGARRVAIENDRKFNKEHDERSIPLEYSDTENSSEFSTGSETKLKGKIKDLKKKLNHAISQNKVLLLRLETLDTRVAAELNEKILETGVLCSPSEDFFSNFTEILKKLNFYRELPQDSTGNYKILKLVSAENIDWVLVKHQTGQYQWKPAIEFTQSELSEITDEIHALFSKSMTHKLIKETEIDKLNKKIIKKNMVIDSLASQITHLKAELKSIPKNVVY